MAASFDHSPDAPHALAELCGTVLEQRYALARVLGAGGMGAVFEARDLRLDRAVAIKVLRPGFAEHAEYAKRFLREAQAASKVRHRNVVVILDYGQAAGGLVYSVMELFIGQDLQQLLHSQPDQRLPWSQACELLAQIASGLKAAHSQGVIHRDIKPANCFLTHEDEEPVVKVVDFGIAKLEDQSPAQQLTSTGSLVGTPSYIAPELVRTQSPASPRSDVYSLGVMAYRMLTGKLPFTGDTAFEVMRRACMEPVPSLGEQVPDLPVAVEELVLEMLAKAPEDRPADMSVVRQRLRALRPRTLIARIEIPASSVLHRKAELLGAENSNEDRTTMPRQPGGSGAMRSQPPAVDITAVQLEPWDERRPRRPARLVGSPPTVIVASAGAPQVINDPAASQSQSRRSLPALDDTTSRVGKSMVIERPRRASAWWLLIGCLALGPVIGGLVWLMTSAGEPGDLLSARVVAAVEPKRAEEQPELEASVEPPAVLVVGETQTGDERLEYSESSAERDANEPVADVVVADGPVEPVADVAVADGPMEPEEIPTSVKIQKASGIRKREKPRETQAPADLPTDGARSRDLTAQADVKRKQGLRNDAKVLYGQALAVDSTNGAAHLGLALVYFDQGAYHQARKAAEKAVEHSPKDGEAHKTLGDALFKEGHYQEAEAAYEEAQRLGVNMGNRLAEVHKKLGK